jgi:hypothetical protein
MEQIPFAYSMYKRSGFDGFTCSDGFKKAFCRTVRIEFLGVWYVVELSADYVRTGLTFYQGYRIKRWGAVASSFAFYCFQFHSQEVSPCGLA